MDIAPVGIVTNEDVFTSESGVTAYLSKVYNDAPFDDFLASPISGYKREGSSSFGAWAGLTGEAMARSQDSQSALPWFTEGYKMLRDINAFIETLPQYASYFTPDKVDTWLGEAYFLRGFVYYTMAKRHGGVILVNEVLDYPNEDISGFMLPRSSEEDTWDQVSADYDMAIKLLGETSPRGRANKSVAAAYKARAMIFAASVANFNEISHFDTERQIRLCGIPKERAVDYYKQAYTAAKMLDGKYQLYMGDWKEGDKQAQYENFLNIFQKTDNVEAIYVEEFQYPTRTHSWDCIFGPLQMRVESVVGGIQPTLDFVEMFDGMDKDSEGKITFMDEKKKYYILYDDPYDPFRNAEPRLRASVLFPGDEFKGEKIQVWRGIYIDPVGKGISKLYKDTSTSKYNNHASVVTASKQDAIESYTLPDGTQMPRAGASGSFTSGGYGTRTGFIFRKLLDVSLPKDLNIPKRSESDWIDMRYAEVLLTKAEAAFELKLLGDSDHNYVTEAYEVVQAIRHRAGADLLTDISQLDREVIRKEIRKELAFENKTYWDMVRWRIFHIEQPSKRRYFAAMPFYVAENGKWFIDRKYSESSTTYTFNAKWYYVEIPEEDIAKNPNIVKNPS
jgi:hypothetical protein